MKSVAPHLLSVVTTKEALWGFSTASHCVDVKVSIFQYSNFRIYLLFKANV
jgi:hypothetical protein